MNIAYCSLLLPEEKHIAERAKGHLSGISLHKFSSAMIAGIDANLNKPLKVFNIINTLNYPSFPDLLFKTEKWKHVDNADDIHIGYVNIFGIKYITQEYNLYRALDKWVNSLNGERFILCVHHNYYPMLKAALMIKKKYGKRAITCLISGDIPGRFGLKSQYKENLKEKMIKIMNNEILSMVKQIDSFIFQTNFMAEGFGVVEKPVCVVECTYLAPSYHVIKPASEYNPKNKKVVFYAGSLRKEYDILHLLESFKYINGDDYEFWLAGGGNAVDDIKEQAILDHRIKYLGFISPQEVFERQCAATVLVNPRKPDHDYVKFSFPSKTVDCLASGKPYIAYKLPCVPDEYKDYIQYANGYSNKDFADKIIEICSLSEAERMKIGEKAKIFILTQKSPKVMCKRVVDFWRVLYCNQN